MIKKHPNKTLIGIFVLGAVALLIIGITVFGTGRVFTKYPTFVMYFSGSVKGLNVGAPVVFRGVKVGTVTDISLRFEPDAVSVNIPVLVELDPNSISTREGKLDPGEYMKLLIAQGLKAQLQLQNLITGQLIIELDFHKERPVRLVGSNSKHPEIPTIPSSLEEFTNVLVNLPLEELMSKLISAIEGINKTVNSEDFAESIQGMNQTLKDLQLLVQSLNDQIDPLSKGFQGTISEAQEFVRNFDKKITTLQTDIDQAAIAARDALAQAEKTFGAIESVTSEDSALIYQVTNTLEELSSAARSIRAWADYLERHPEAIIRGKTEYEGRQ
ncbi:MAG TPA: MlaD family protein [Deltaproteobacteria bacterium]|nr:MlaD family protein [Deltaproteobacteria bacterium]HPR51174.1 MlaD family protein [Deltaproteobacteria bacterium]